MSLEQAWVDFLKQNPNININKEGELPDIETSVGLSLHSMRSCSDCVGARLNTITCCFKHPETGQSDERGLCHNLDDDGWCKVYGSEEYPEDCKKYFCPECTDGDMNKECY